MAEESIPVGAEFGGEIVRTLVLVVTKPCNYSGSILIVWQRIDRCHRWGLVCVFEGNLWYNMDANKIKLFAFIVHGEGEVLATPRPVPQVILEVSLMNDPIVPHQQHPLSLREQAGQRANEEARQGTFAEFRALKSQNTLAAHDADLGRFEMFLAGEYNMMIDAPDGIMAYIPEAWQTVTWGLVKKFRQSLLDDGYAISTVNRALSTVKRYAGLAFQAGALSETEHALIKTVKGYSSKEGKRIDEARAKNGVETRRSPDTGAVGKKREHTPITTKQARKLKRNHPDTPQGRRDALLMHILLDLGLRCGEVSGLTVGNVNLAEGTLTFYRPKVDMTQTHELKRDLLAAMKAYFEGDAEIAKDAPLLHSSRKNAAGELSRPGLSKRSITQRVQVLGERNGIEGLSAHDCRHYWATNAARNGTDPFALQEAGGWKSLAMPRRYIEAARIANENVHLDV